MAGVAIVPINQTPWRNSSSTCSFEIVSPGRIRCGPQKRSNGGSTIRIFACRPT